ncbi:MAG: DegV family protein [Erysipelotrichaceae bacterium]
MKVAIISDSGSNFSILNVNMEGVYFLPLQLSTNNINYIENVDIDVTKCYEMLERKMMFKTSLPPVGIIEETVKKIKEDGYDQVFSVNISLGLSSTIQSIKLVCDMLEMPFAFVDCYTTANNQLNVALLARQLFDKGCSVTQVKELLEELIENSCTYIIPDDLMHLAAGGRLTNTAASIGQTLKIKPILKMDKSTGGRIDSYKIIRTVKKGLEIIVDDIVKRNSEDNLNIVCAHVNNEEKAIELKEMLLAHFPNSAIVVCQLPPTVGVHVGVKALGCAFISKDNEKIREVLENEKIHRD